MKNKILAQKILCTVICILTILNQNWQSFRKTQTENTLSPRTVLETNPARRENSDNYEIFQNWLSTISPDALTNTTLVYKGLQAIAKNLDNSSIFPFPSEVTSLIDLINTGLVTKENIEETQIIQNLIQSLNTPSRSIHQSNTEVLKFLILEGFVTRKITEGTQILKTIVEELHHLDTIETQDNTEILTTLVSANLITEEEAMREIEKTNVLQNIVKCLNNPNSSIRQTNAKALTTLTSANLITKEEAMREIEKTNALQNIVNDLNDLDSSVRQANTEVLTALVSASLITKEKATREIEKANVIQTIKKCFKNSTISTRQDNTIILTTLITTGFITKEEIKRINVLEAVIDSFNDGVTYDHQESAQALTALANSRLLDKKKITQKLKEACVLQNIVKHLNNPEIYIHQTNADALIILATSGILTNEEIQKTGTLQTVVKNLHSSDSSIRLANTKVLANLVNTRLITKEETEYEVKRTSTLQRVTTDLIEMYDPYNREKNILTLTTLIDAKLITQEETIREINITMALQNITNGLNHPHSSVRRTSAGILSTLVDTGLIKKEEVVQEVKKTAALQTLIEGLNHSNSFYRLDNARTLTELVHSGLIAKEEAIQEIKKTTALQTIMKHLGFTDNRHRQDSTKTLSILISEGLVAKDEILIEIGEIENMLKKIYGEKIPALESINRYLELLDIVKDDTATAYRIAIWGKKNLSELLSFIDNLAIGLRLNPDCVGGKNSNNLLELKKAFIKTILPLLDTPEALIQHIRQKMRTTIYNSSVKLSIRVYEIASVNATRGLIRALGLPCDNVTILCSGEINIEQAGTFFPKYEIKQYEESVNRNTISVEFHDDNNIRVKFLDNTLSVVLPYTPFKFNLPKTLSEERVIQMRNSLGIGSRKIIVLGSPSNQEFESFMETYKTLYGELPISKRPVLIVGFRQRRENENELKLLASLSGQSIAIRSNPNITLPNIENNNVLILNTSGELLNMYALADIAIVGSDRNIFEPASQRIATLYFNGSWHNNSDVKDSLIKEIACLAFSKENLERLLNTPQEREQMAKNGLKAVELYRKEVLSKAEAFAIEIIGAIPELRKEFMNSYPSIILPNHRLDTQYIDKSA